MRKPSIQDCTVIGSLDGVVASPMVERVARAVHDSIERDPSFRWGDCHPNYRRLKMLEARAAIDAMREPTRAMLEDGSFVDQPGDVWQAMIDAALREPQDSALKEPAGE